MPFFFLHVISSKDQSPLLPGLCRSHTRSISFLSSYFPPYCIPSWIFPLRTELIYRPQSSPGLGRKIARRQINDPFSVAQENASTRVRLWHRTSRKNPHRCRVCDDSEEEHTPLRPALVLRTGRKALERLCPPTPVLPLGR